MPKVRAEDSRLCGTSTRLRVEGLRPCQVSPLPGSIQACARPGSGLTCRMGLKSSHGFATMRPSALVRTDLRPSDELGGGGGRHRGEVGDERKRITAFRRVTTPRPRSFWGWPSANANPWSRKPEGRKKRRGVEGHAQRTVQQSSGPKGSADLPARTYTPKRSPLLADRSTKPWRSVQAGIKPGRRFFLPSGQSGNRKVLLRESGVSTGLRAQVVCIESSRKRRGVVAGQPDRAGRQNAVSNCGADQGMLAYSHPCRPLSNATSQGRRFLLLSLTPYAPVLKAYRQRELQAGYRIVPGTVASQAVVAALGHTCQGNGGCVAANARWGKTE